MPDNIELDEDLRQEEEREGALSSVSEEEDDLPPPEPKDDEEDEFSGMTEEEKERALELGYKPRGALKRKEGWKSPAEFLKKKEAENARAEAQIRQRDELIRQQSEMLKKLTEEFADFRNGMTQDKEAGQKASYQNAIAATKEAIKAAAREGDEDKVEELTEKLERYAESLAAIKSKESAKPAAKPKEERAEANGQQDGRQYSVEENVEIQSFLNKHAKAQQNPAVWNRVVNYQAAQENAAQQEYSLGLLPAGETPLTHSLKLTERFLKTMYPESETPARKPQADLNGNRSANNRPSIKSTYGTPDGLTSEGKRYYDQVKTDLGEKGASLWLKRSAENNPDVFREKPRS